MIKSLFSGSLLILIGVCFLSNSAFSQFKVSDGKKVVVKQSDGTIIDGEPFKIILPPTDRRKDDDNGYDPYDRDQRYQYDRRYDDNCNCDCRHDNGKHKGWYKDKHKKHKNHEKDRDEDEDDD